MTFILWYFLFIVVYSCIRFGISAHESAFYSDKASAGWTIVDNILMFLAAVFGIVVLFKYAPTG